jgi:pyruvate/2-oxoglutarate dehydrogenase complex dihydrolipoamide dehydrogenase (E3) component
MHLVRDRAAEFGVCGVDPEKLYFDLAATVARKDSIVAGIHDGVYKALGKNKNITFLKGHAEFVSPVDIRVDDRTISADKTILAVGSHTAPAMIPGLEEIGYITNNEALKLKELPGSMIIIGGGYIGVEFAQMYARYGTRITLLGRASHLMPKEEPELSEALAQVLRAEGIDVRTLAPVIEAGREDGLRFVVAEIDGEPVRFETEKILFAAGRTARVEELGLAQAGVELKGVFIRADDQLRTTAGNIWSLGDANGGAMFTHRATYDGPIAALNVVKDLGREVDYRVVPHVVFTDPALASVGLTEAQARDLRHEVKVGTSHFADSGRAKALAQTDGMVKIILDAENDEILGAHILGAHADILIHEVVVAMYDHGKVDSLSKSIHVHPTLSEIVKSAAKNAK